MHTVVLHVPALEQRNMKGRLTRLQNLYPIKLAPVPMKPSQMTLSSTDPVAFAIVREQLTPAEVPALPEFPMQILIGKKGACISKLANTHRVSIMCHDTLHLIRVYGSLENKYRACLAIQRIMDKYAARQRKK